MTPLVIAALCLTMVATSFLSGVFGMAGGLILVGVLLALLPLPAAMVLHAVTQMASNGWRAALWWRHIRWRAIGAYLAGCLIALLVWSLWRYVPGKPIALLMLGTTPFLARLVRDRGYRCRIYAPVGGHRDLLAYLVRRLLENGANSSFVHQLADERLSEEEILAEFRTVRDQIKLVFEAYAAGYREASASVTE